MSKEQYRNWQSAMVAVLIKKTDEHEPKIIKAKLAESIGISFPTLKKLYEGESDLTIPIFWAWCEAIDTTPEDVTYIARTGKTYELGTTEPLTACELLSVMPQDVKASMRLMMEGIAKSVYQHDESIKLSSAPMTREDCERMRWMKTGDRKQNHRLEGLRQSIGQNKSVDEIKE